MQKQLVALLSAHRLSQSCGWALSSVAPLLKFRLVQTVWSLSASIPACLTGRPRVIILCTRFLSVVVRLRANLLSFLSL